MFKGNLSFFLFNRFHFCAFFNGGLCLKHFIDSFRCNTCPRKHNRHHSQHQERHNNHHGISDKCGHGTYLHQTIVNLAGCHPYDQKCDTVHERHHSRHHKCHDTVRKQCRLRQICICFIKSFFLFFFSAECADNLQSSQNLA